MYDYDASTPGGVDVIFSGGGTTACVAAARLAQQFPDCKILVIEGGKNNLNDPTVVHPALFMVHLIPGSTTAKFYSSEPSTHVAGREVVVPAGGMLGGGSSINLSMYTRAQAIDYDSWATPGWMAEDMMPLCNKTETYYVDGKASAADNHGDSGPVKISDGGFRSKSQDQVMKTIVDMGMAEVTDVNDFKTIGGFMRIPRYVSPDGTRQDAAHCYIHPVMQTEDGPKNLHILFNSIVTRVLFDETCSPPKAIGVEVKPTSSDDESRKLLTVHAAKLVVLSSGALGTPQILERSGVGNRSLLNTLDIPVVADLPGVGENYQDHHLVSSSYQTSLPPGESLDSLASGREDVGSLMASRDPRLGWNTIDVAGKLRPDDLSAKQLGPEFYTRWEMDWARNANKPMMIMNFINTFVGNPADAAPDIQHLTIGCISLYPYSRGSIHITDTAGGYKFDSGFLGDPVDVKMQVWAYKLARSIARRLPFFTGEVAAAHPAYGPDSAAAVVSSPAATSTDSAEVVYSEEDDAAIETWVRKTVGTTWHSLGTCAMKPREARGVVDARLNVHATQHLKVADLSIAPENIGANVGNTAFAVGEKAALIIAEELS